MNEELNIDAAFSALADPTRRAILARLAKGEATVMELAKPFAMTQPAISQHLKVLEDAGLIARRILCSVREGDPVTAGDRFGIIRFGSRADLYLPEGVRPLVAVGQTMVGGETVIADVAA